MNLFLSKYYFPIIVFLLCILRLITLDLQPLSLDELTTVNLLSTTKGLSFVIQWIKQNDTQLPLFYIIQYYVFQYVGNSTFLLRLPSLIYVLAGIYFCYQYTAKNTYTNNKKFISLFLFTSFILTFHSQEVRPYGLLFLLSSLCFTLFDNKSKKITFYIVLMLLSLTHYYGLALALIQLFLKMIQVKNINNKKWLFLIITFLSVFLFFFGHDIYTDLLVIHPYREHFSLKAVIDIVVYLIGGKFVFTAIFIAAAYYIIKEKKLIKLNNMYLASLLLVLAALSKSLLTTPVLEARYFIGLMLPITMLISHYVKNDVTKLIIIVLAVYNTYFDQAITLRPYRLATNSAAKYINNKYLGNVFVTSCDINLSYYIPRFNDCYYGQCTLKNVTKVVYIQMNKNPYNCQIRQEIELNYKKVETKSFKGLQVHYYKKK